MSNDMQRRVNDALAKSPSFDVPVIRRVYFGGTEILSFEDFALQIQDEDVALDIARTLIQMSHSGGGAFPPNENANPDAYEEYEVIDLEALERIVANEADKP